MNEAGIFLYDIVQPGGKKLSRTFVTRTLIGAPGSTYKYLGLRLFSHPWCQVTADGNASIEEGTSSKSSLVELGYSKTCAKALLDIGKLNQTLIQRTHTALKTHIAPHIPNNMVGSADYSLTLINRMEPSTVKNDLKLDKIHGMGKTSVSWHKDSGLQDFSSIAVYHSMEPHPSTNSTDAEQPWRVALRVADSNSKTPALSVPLPSGAVYYLLDDFNHQHEHAVLAGAETLRYSSTHRVAKVGCGTWQYIREKCEKVLSLPLCTRIGIEGKDITDIVGCFDTVAKRKQLEKSVRTCESLLTELEFEWIRQ